MAHKNVSFSRFWLKLWQFVVIDMDMVGPMDSPHHTHTAHHTTRAKPQVNNKIVYSYKYALIERPVRID